MARQKRWEKIPFAFDGSQERYAEMVAELSSQTDRGAAILGASFLEWRVRQAIKSRLKVWDESAESIFGTDAVPPKLGFTDQCRMAYCLGLIGPFGLDDLKMIARIRNRFAHQFGVTSFSSDVTVKKQCYALKSPESAQIVGTQRIALPGKPIDEGPRKRFEVTVNLLFTMIWSQAHGGIVRWPKPRARTMFW